ncbi:hypothetical protein cypCar_00001624 [Cyprinus carpio]|nr:hypothetical protein cypCar_00001624 [Cyprinus carpio]
MASVAKKTDSTSMRPAYYQVKPPWQPDAHNQSEDFESFQVPSLSNRKNKPLAPQLVLSDSDKNSTEILDYPSGFGPEAFFYDINLDDDVFSLFDFDSTYSLDESLATAIPHNMSFLEVESVLAVNTTAFGPMRQAVSKQEHLHSQSDLSVPWAMSELAQVSERLETDSSWTLIPSPAMTLRGTEDIFYRLSLVVTDEQANTPDRDAKTMISQWLNQTFQNWIYRVYVESVRQTYMALLVYKNTTDASLAEVQIENILRSAPAIGNGLILNRVTVNLMENCRAEEFPFHYRWPESRPTVTQYIPCFPYKEQNASRTCMISQYNYTSYWTLPDRGNCTNITSISVSQENAMEVAVQLADITNSELSKEEVTQVVFKVKELVNIAKINATLASTVVTIISNVMISSEAAQKDASETYVLIPAL